MNDLEFELMFGRPPENDELDRLSCPDAGKPFHMWCGQMLETLLLEIRDEALTKARECSKVDESTKTLPIAATKEKINAV